MALAAPTTILALRHGETRWNVEERFHGGVLDSLFRFAARLPLSQPRCYVTINASLNIFSHGRFYGTDRWVIQKWADTGHMADVGHYQGLG